MVILSRLFEKTYPENLKYNSYILSLGPKSGKSLVKKSSSGKEKRSFLAKLMKKKPIKSTSCEENFGS